MNLIPILLLIGLIMLTIGIIKKIHLLSVIGGLISIIFGFIMALLIYIAAGGGFVPG